MNRTLKEFVDRSWVTRVTSEEIEPTMQAPTDRIKLLSDAGFTAITNNLKKRRHIAEQTSSLNKERQKFAEKAKDFLILKVPNFRKMKVEEPSMLRRISEWLGISFVTSGIGGTISIAFFGNFVGAVLGIFPVIMWPILVEDERSITRWDFHGINLSHGKYLIEVAPDKFVGHVPDGIAQKAIELRNKGLTPRIWFIGGKKTIKETIEGEIIEKVVDPLLVGRYFYDQTDYSWRENTTYKDVGYAVLAAAWGKDIEDLDQYFGGDNQ